MIRVLIADDHGIVRSGLKMLIDRQSDMEVVAEAENGPDAVRLAAELQPDVVVMDLHMPGGNGIEATRTITRTSPRIGVLVLTIANRDLRSAESYTARFTDVTALNEGDEVRISGVKVGEVESIELVDRRVAAPLVSAHLGLTWVALLRPAR